MKPIVLVASLLCLAAAGLAASMDERLEQLRKQYPKADANGDGRLTVDEARAYERQMRKGGTAQSAAASRMPAPDRADVKYGPHERNVFDWWRAPTNAPAPLVVFIHGGGFVGGDKSKASPEALRMCREAGAAFMTINYRFREHAPIQDILRDCARAIQFVRLHAEEFGVDPKRVASFGGSAGAGTSLWLATHDDLADPKNADPVLRQSSRLAAAAGLNPQATYDLAEWERVVYPFKPEWYEPEEKNRFYHFRDDAEFDSERGRRIREDCSMLHWISADDPPIFLSCSQSDGEPISRGHLLHHPKHCRIFQDRAAALGVPVEMHLADDAAPGVRGDVTVAAVAFLLRHLQAADPPVAAPSAGASAGEGRPR